MAEFTRIIKGTPINRVANRVIQSGTHYDFKVRTKGELFSADPLPTRPWGGRW